MRGTSNEPVRLRRHAAKVVRQRVGAADVGTRKDAAGRQVRQKDEYSEWECKAMFDELERAGLNEEGSDLDAIEALFRRLNMADEAAKARSMIMG